MSIKKLFENPRNSKNFLAETTKKTSFDDVESAENVVQKQKDIYLKLTILIRLILLNMVQLDYIMNLPLLEF